jgi:hypothetical protein
MREHLLLETSYLAGLLFLSMVLPLLMSFRSPQDAANKTACMKIVWRGQAILALAGLTVLASSLFAPYAAAFGFLSCIWCALALHGHFRAAHSA